MAVFKIGADEIVFAGEMPVERDFGDPRLGDHSVDARGTDTVAVKQRVRSLQQAVAGRQVFPVRRRQGNHVGIVDKSVYISL